MSSLFYCWSEVDNLSDIFHICDVIKSAIFYQQQDSVYVGKNFDPDQDPEKKIWMKILIHEKKN